MAVKQKVKAFPILIGSAAVGLVIALIAATGSFHDSGLGLSPWLTQTVKTLIAVRWKNLDRQDHCTAF